MDIFSKESYSPADIQNLIDSKFEESLKIEFKNAAALANTENNKKEISKDISSFANSDGGLIFYGINEENHVASGLSFADGEVTTKEWLENVIVSNIQQRIEGLEIHPVRFDEDIKKTVYVVKIPRSDRSPHMAKDQKFYRRYNFKSVCMEEYEVRQLYYTSREGSVIIESVGVRDADKEAEYFTQYHFLIDISITNIGMYLAEKYKVACKINTTGKLGFQTQKNNSITDLGEEGFKISSTRMIPIFPEETLNALSFTIIIDKHEFDETIEKTNFEMYTFSNNQLNDSDLEIKNLLKEVRNDIDNKLLSRYN